MPRLRLFDAQLISPLDSAARGAVYTPPGLARWVALRLLGALPAGPLTVADLACGRGALLNAVADSRRGVRLVGVDIDRDDLRIAAAALPGARWIEADALTLSAEVGPFDGIILNPPWGVSLPHGRDELRALGYTLAQGQFDSANLFVELALSMLRPQGVAAFILPDSIFFPEHVRLRRLLLEQTQALLVARLGEGFFRDVFRGTGVVIVRRGKPAPDHDVECLRLAVEDRRAILAGERDLDAVATAQSHRVPQTRFARSWDLDISVRSEHAGFVNKLRSHRAPWSQSFNSGRGVELSKSGRVVRCPACGHAWPLPRVDRTLECRACRSTSASDTLPVKTLVRPLAEAEPGWAPLIAGVDVQRYRCVPTHAIRVGVPGINYKSDDVPRGERVLVRKTGVGLRTALTNSPAYTTQVVFHYTPLGDAPPFLAAYVQGVLSSRVMLAYHLLDSGESEWRSHPYVTQKVIGNLPVPDLGLEPELHEQAEAIARAARAYSRAPSEAADLAVETLVAQLFGLDAADVGAVACVLNEAQDLDGIREMRFDASVIRAQAGM